MLDCFIPGIAAVALSLAPAITGRVSRPDGSARPWAEIFLFRKVVLGPFEPLPPPIADALAGADGEFALENVPGGTYWLVAYQDGVTSAGVVRVRNKTQERAITLPDKVSMAGVVLQGKTPMKGATVTVFDDRPGDAIATKEMAGYQMRVRKQPWLFPLTEGQSYSGAHPVSCVTDESGNYQCRGLMPGYSRVTVQPAGSGKIASGYGWVDGARVTLLLIGDQTALKLIQPVKAHAVDADDELTW